MKCLPITDVGFYIYGSWNFYPVVINKETRYLLQYTFKHKTVELNIYVTVLKRVSKFGTTKVCGIDTKRNDFCSDTQFMFRITNPCFILGFDYVK